MHIHPRRHPVASPFSDRVTSVVDMILIKNAHTGTMACVRYLHFVYCSGSKTKRSKQQLEQEHERCTENISDCV